MRCASCRAQLEPTDRYCPACRMPHMGAARHPRFGPPERDPGPAIAPRQVAKGQRPCPRCESGVRSADRYCRSCGLDFSRMPQPLDSEFETGPSGGPGPRRPQPAPEYHSLRPATQGLRLVVVAVAVTGLALALVSALIWRRLDGEIPMLALPAAPIDWPVLQAWVQGLALLQALLVLAASALMIRWTAQATANGPALRVSGARVDRLWATLGWLVPGVNLVVPKLAVDDLWRSAEPEGPADSTTWRSRPVPTLLHVWWLCTLVALPTVLLAGSELVRVGDLPPLTLAEIHNSRAAFVLVAVAEGLLVFAAVLFTRVLTEICDRQTARARHLDERLAAGKAPAPLVATADAAPRVSAPIAVPSRAQDATGRRGRGPAAPVEGGAVTPEPIFVPVGPAQAARRY